MDNKAIVRNSESRSFFSYNGHAFVIEDINLESHFNLAKSYDKAIIPIKDITGDNEFNPTEKINVAGLIPYTIKVYGNQTKEVPFPIRKFNIIKDLVINDSDISKYYTKVYAYRLQPTNINYKPASAIVYGTELDQTYDIQLESARADVRSKAEIKLPDVSNYGNMILTVQKNCFIEIKLQDDVVDVIKLPDSLTYSSGYIKGTFTKSGNYSIIIEYSDGRQTIDVIVPYYQRLL